MLLLPTNDLPTFLSAFAVGTMASARVTRLIVEDEWPPMMWVRDQWDRRTQTSKWNLLLHCQYCASPWVALLDVILAAATGLHLLWWLVNLWLAVSYVAAMIVSWDIED